MIELGGKSGGQVAPIRQTLNSNEGPNGAQVRFLMPKQNKLIGAQHHKLMNDTCGNTRWRFFEFFILAPVLFRGAILQPFQIQ